MFRRLLLQAFVTIAVVQSTLSEAVALPDMTTRQMLALIEKKDFEALDFFTGAAHGLEWANSFLAAQDKPQMFCPPKKIEFTVDQRISEFRNYVKEHPDATSQPFELVLLFAMIDNFPCTQP